MKIQIEDKDVEHIVEMAERYGVTLTEEQSFDLINHNRSLAAALFEDDSFLDDSSIVGTCLIDWVMPNALTKKGYRYSWPCYGDLRGYEEEFNAKFKEAAITKGLRLTGKRWE